MLVARPQSWVHCLLVATIAFAISWFGELARDHPPKYQMTGVKASEKFTKCSLHLVLNSLARVTEMH